MSTPSETPANLQEPARQPRVIEGPGRYVVYEAQDGGWVIARALGLCETCANCGCGEQGELIQVPGMVIKLAMRQGNGNLLGMLKAAARR